MTKTMSEAEAKAAEPTSAPADDSLCPFKTAEDVLAYYQMRLRVSKDQHNEYGQYNYRNLETINDTYKRVQAELWEKFGLLTCLYYPDDQVFMNNGYLKRNVVAMLYTPFGTIHAEMSVREPEKQAGMNPSQVSGSSSSYARKYAVQGLFAIGGEKDPDELPPAVEDTYPDGKFNVKCRRCGRRGYDFDAHAAMTEVCEGCGAVDWETA